MYTLYNNIVSDIFFHSGICVDFLGTHMISLVLFFRKPGVTHQRYFPQASHPENFHGSKLICDLDRPPLKMCTRNFSGLSASTKLAIDNSGNGL
jgi:hypothetical protein